MKNPDHDKMLLAAQIMLCERAIYGPVLEGDDLRRSAGRAFAWAIALDDARVEYWSYKNKYLKPNQ